MMGLHMMRNSSRSDQPLPADWTVLVAAGLSPLYVQEQGFPAPSSKIPEVLPPVRANMVQGGCATDHIHRIRKQDPA